MAKYWEYHSIVTKNSDPIGWDKAHRTVTDRLAEGWTLQASHAVADSLSIVVYFYLTRITDIETPEQS